MKIAIYPYWTLSIIACGWHIYLDNLVNNAGISRSPNENATLRKNLRAVFETNVFGVAVMKETFLPLIRASAYPQRQIGTITSGLGIQYFIEQVHK